MSNKKLSNPDFTKDFIKGSFPAWYKPIKPGSDASPHSEPRRICVKCKKNKIEWDANPRVCEPCK